MVAHHHFFAKRNPSRPNEHRYSAWAIRVFLDSSAEEAIAQFMLVQNVVKMALLRWFEKASPLPSLASGLGK